MPDNKRLSQVKKNLGDGLLYFPERYIRVPLLFHLFYEYGLCFV